MTHPSTNPRIMYSDPKSPIILQFEHEIQLQYDAVASKVLQIVSVTADGPFGNTETKKISYEDNSILMLYSYPNHPFLYLQKEVTNATNQQLILKESTFPEVSLILGKSGRTISEYKVLGCDGLTPPTLARASYTFLAIGSPNKNDGIVYGWLNQELGSGITFSRFANDQFHLSARSEYGNLRIPPGHTIKTDFLAIGYFSNIIHGLEEYGTTIGRFLKIKLPLIKGGYCTWYTAKHNGAGDEASMAELAKFCAKEVVPFGFEILQIDDKWQAGPSRTEYDVGQTSNANNGVKRGLSNSGPHSDFTTHNPNGPYPHGMKIMAQKIQENGMKPGIWLMPFAWDPEGSVTKDHHEWFVKKPDGSIYQVGWAGWCLDMTNPEARTFLGSVIRRITHEWGYKYLKMDGLWSGMAVRLLYTRDPKYLEDDLGDATFHDASQTNIQAFRKGLKTVRENAALGTILQTCTVAQNVRTLGATMGLTDAMRIGRDIGARWRAIIPDAEVSGRLFFLNTHVWYNDPDCLMLRPPLTVNQARAWASLITISGQLNIVSEWLPDLSADRLDIFKRTLPMTGLNGRPLDLFRENIATIWHMQDSRHGSEHRRDIIGLFNWVHFLPQRLSIPFEELGIPNPSQDYIGFDYWNNEFIEHLTARTSFIVKHGSCRVIAVRPKKNIPQIVSTSRHICQGIVDIIEENWTGSRIEAVSQVVANDPYEIRLISPQSYDLKSVEVISNDTKSSIQIHSSAEKGRIRIIIQSSISCAIKWFAEFTKTP